MLKLTIEPPKYFEINRDGITEKWHYEVLSLKFLFDELEEKHNMRVDNVLLLPTDGFVAELAERLDSQFGLTGCTPAIANQIYSVVNVQIQDFMDETDKLLEQCAREEAERRS